MKWIKEHKLLTMIICVFLALVVTISVSFFVDGQSGSIGSKIKSVVYTIETPINSFSNFISSFGKGIFSYNDLIEENEALKEEVNRLKKEAIQNKLKLQDLNDLNELSEALNYKFINRGENIVSANVLTSDSTVWFDLFTIDRGSNDGIEKDDVVILGPYLIGTIYEVGPEYSKVISILDALENISFEVYRDITILGIISGDGDGNIEGYMLDNESKVVEGDIIITSNTGTYPEGIEIGKVTSVEYNKDTELKTITVEPSADFSNLRKVSVIL